MRDGFVRRYEPEPEVDGLPPGEGAFLPCTFWLADYLALIGPHDEARRIVRAPAGAPQRRRPAGRGVRPGAKRLVGNFPQAFSHVGLVNTALNLWRGSSGPATARGTG